MLTHIHQLDAISDTNIFKWLVVICSKKKFKRELCG